MVRSPDREIFEVLTLPQANPPTAPSALTIPSTSLLAAPRRTLLLPSPT